MNVLASGRYFGMMTVSITWMTPFDAAMSVFTTCALSTITWPPIVDTLIERALHGLGVLHLDDVGGHDLAGYHVVGEDGGQLGLVLGLQQILDGALRQLGERLVGRREHRERARALQRLDQAGRLERRCQRLELTGGHRRGDDVAALGASNRASRKRERRNRGAEHESLQCLHAMSPLMSSDAVG